MTTATVRVSVDPTVMLVLRTIADRLDTARELFRRALGPHINGTLFIHGMAIPTRVRTCSGTRRRRNARRR